LVATGHIRERVSMNICDTCAFTLLLSVDTETKHTDAAETVNK